MMKIKLVSAVAVLCTGSVTFAQTQAPSTGNAGTQTRPDAVYPKPSGQDSQPSKTTVQHKANAQGTPEARGSQTAQQSKPAQAVSQQGGYQGPRGKKGDPGTACSTAKPKANGQLDCGTGGNGATPGNVPK